ncbi:dystroglycan-like [Dorcoceras hygrometricum]|uniref:Dystroglycan-like n=1 Tax=Dorcoceras hygrometricum TaxID=472368 RepID=A0A2Z7D4Z3_9LAMI|nr:dystroglycan-like [Dorcoceras hygrometricum]
MASSFYSNSQHVDFESVLSMDDQGMVSMFKALMASGLAGFLGCPAVIYEDALVDFFENASVREGVIISTVAGQLVEISEEWFAESFELPVDGEPVSLSGRKNQMRFEFRLLCDIMAKAISVKAGSFNAITVEKFSLITAVVCSVRMNWAKILFSIFKRMVTPGSKQAKGFAIQISLLLANIPNLELGASSEGSYWAIMQRAASKKRPAADVVAAVTKKKRTSKRKLTLETVVVAQEAIPIQSVPVSTATEPMVEDQQAVFSQEQPADEPLTVKSAASTEERHCDTDEEDVLMDVGTAGEDQQVQEPVAQISNDDLLDADEQKSLDDILLSIPVDVPLPSAGMEITNIKMGETIKILGVTEKTWFLNSLPSIPDDHKGKTILVEKDPIMGNPAQEHFYLICADIDLLVELRAKIIDEVAQFFHSFSLRKLATFNLEDMYKREEQVLSWGETELPQFEETGNIQSRGYVQKEEQVLSWGETELPQVAIQRKLYILIKYREVLARKFLESWRANFVPGQGSTAVDLKVINLLTDLHLSILEELAKEARAHGRLWTKTCCSTIFEGSPRDRGAVIARTNTNTRSSCWIRTMILVDGVWIVEPCADRWVKIPRRVVSNEVHRQRQYDDTLPSIYESQSGISSKLHKIEQGFRDSLNEQAAVVKNLFQEACQEGRSMDDVQTLRFNEFRKNILAQNASIFVGLADVRKEDAEATKEALSHQLFEFQSQAQENQNILHAQLSELVDYIHRGSADKNGESGSRGPQQTSNVQIEGSAVRTPTFAQRVEMAQRHIVHTVLDADANRELLERQAAAERDRERIRREARMLKRRRRD